MPTNVGKTQHGARQSAYHIAAIVDIGSAKINITNASDWRTATLEELTRHVLGTIFKDNFTHDIDLTFDATRRTFVHSGYIVRHNPNSRVPNSRMSRWSHIHMSIPKIPQSATTDYLVYMMMCICRTLIHEFAHEHDHRAKLSFCRHFKRPAWSNRDEEHRAELCVFEHLHKMLPIVDKMVDKMVERMIGYSK
jgi:hypothetical protein